MRRLQVFCRQAGRLPSSCLISTEVVLEVLEPHCKSHFSDVYRGRLGKTPVALKALRVHIDSKAKVEKASDFPQRIGSESWPNADDERA